MESQEKITWEEVKEVINLTKKQYSLMLQYQENVSQDDMPQKMAEQLCVNPIKKINEICNKVLKANNIQTADQIDEQNRIKKLVESIVNVQSEIAKKGENSHIDMLLASTMKDLKS